jgi:TatD DNase family protein
MGELYNSNEINKTKEKLRRLLGFNRVKIVNMIDVHCHLTDDKYADDRKEIINEAERLKIRMITNGTGTKDSLQATELAKKHPDIWVCVGTAYEDGYENTQEVKAELEKLCELPKVVGIGETGLNYYEGMTDERKDYQQKLFKTHLDLAREHNLPVQIHNRGANEDIQRILKQEYPELKEKVLLHCFTGPANFMQQMLDWGCFVSFGGKITYKTNEELRNLVKTTPENRLLIETDAPYLPPHLHRGERNRPVNVRIVSEKAAEIRGESLEKLIDQTSDNAHRLFAKMR